MAYGSTAASRGVSGR